MKIIADQNIPVVKEAFGSLGEVITISGRDMTCSSVKDADVLLVRSITKVDGSLLDNTRIKFVGTATIGTDHVDEKYLSERNICFASAPGSNADSVAEYMVSAILNLEKNKNIKFTGKTIGIIGCGNVGSRVKKRMETIGMNCLVNDPPLERMTGQKGFVSLDELLSSSDMVTVHVPLTKKGDCPTYKMIDDKFLAKMEPGVVLFNTSRGSVMDEEALYANRSRLGALVLDVWNDEPAINMKTLDITDIATPHIAGYSFDGKIRGTAMLYSALCDFLKIEKKTDFSVFTQSGDVPPICLKDSGDLLYDVINCAYPVMRDDSDLRRIKLADNPGGYFDKLRKEYYKRREFFNHTVITGGVKPVKEIEILKNLGFVVS